MKHITILLALTLSVISYGQTKMKIVSTMHLNQSITIKGNAIEKTETNYNVSFDEKEIEIINKETGEKMKFVVWTDDEPLVDTYKQGISSADMHFFQPLFYIDNKPQGQIESILIDSISNKIVIYNNGDIMILSVK